MEPATAGTGGGLRSIADADWVVVGDGGLAAASAADFAARAPCVSSICGARQAPRRVAAVFGRPQDRHGSLLSDSVAFATLFRLFGISRGRFAGVRASGERCAGAAHVS